MKINRLDSIISFISKNDYVVDIGTDHGFIPIKLKEKKLCKEVIATDINENALFGAKKNIKAKKLKLKTYLSDGLTNIDDKNIDTAIIAGMGTTTILHIIDTFLNFNIKKVIIQSNNDLYMLRTNMIKKGYFLQDEKVILDKKHFYVIGKYTKTHKHLSILEKYFGIYKKENISYYKYLHENINKIKDKISKKYIFKRLKLNYKLHLLKKYL